MAVTKDMEYYWAQANRIAAHREAGAEKEIRKIYRSLSKELQAFLSDAYVKYAQDDVLTYAMLQKAAYDARFLEEIEKKVGVENARAAKELRQLVSDVYQITYDGIVKGVQKLEVDGIDDAFADTLALTPYQVKKAISNPIMEMALEKNRKDIMYEIKQAVVVGLMVGDRYTTMARRISEHLAGEKGAYAKAMRIARTEAHRAREAGSLDAALKSDKALQKGENGLRFVKKWKTMQDERVRPNYIRKGKKGISKKAKNHVILNGQIVLVDEEFDLKDGNKAPCPGQTGVAGHDINCRCLAIKVLMDDEEFFAATGRHFPNSPASKEEQALKKEMELMNDQTKLQADYKAVEKEMQQLDSKQFENIWKNPVTAKDYEQLKDRLPAKRAYFQANNKPDLLALCDEFEEVGERYLAAKDRYTTLGKELDDLADNLKAARLEIMKARGIDPQKMQKEIDDLAAKIASLKTPIAKKVSMGTKVKNYDQQELKDALHYILPYADDGDLDNLLKQHSNSTIKGLMDASMYATSKKTAFKKKLEQLATKVGGDPAEIAKLERLLRDKEDALEKVRKRYGLEDDKFSKARKDKAYWFKGADARKRGDAVLRPDTGTVWASAPAAERQAAYKYTSGSGSFNRPLRGYAGSWSNFKGVGKVDLDYEGSGAAIQHLTDIINKNPSSFDIWLQRGVESSSGAAGFLGISESLLNASQDDLQQMLLGKVVKDEAFTSTAAAKGSGFSGRLIMNIYAPKGTKMIYAEPFSAYGHGAKSSWDGISSQSSFGSEFEVILQRGTSFKITKVEKSGYTIYIDVDVVGQ